VDVPCNALSVTVTVPLFEPFDVGVKVTLIKQFAFGARAVLCAQVVPVASAKLPLMLTVESVSCVVPVLVRVIVFDALVVPLFWLPKLRLEGFKLAAGLITVAVMSTICGLPAPLSTVTRFAACVLVTFESAVKLIKMVQLFPAFSVFGQKVMPRKPEESSPEIEAMLKLENVTMDAPVFVTVMVSISVVPTYTLPKLSGDGENFTVEPGEFTVCGLPVEALEM